MLTYPAADVSTPRQQESYEYYSDGNVKKKTLADSSEVHYEYFLTGDLKKTWGSQTYEQNYTYDTQGRRLTLITDGNRVTTWHYNPLRGWLDFKEYDDGKGPTYDYTPSGKLETRYWADGGDTIYLYNNAGELSFIDYYDTTPDVTFTYNRRGLKDTITDAAGTRQVSYNAAGVSSGESFSSGLFSGLVTYKGFDSLLRNDMAYVDDLPTGFFTSYGYGYDAASRISTVVDSTPSDVLEFDYTYETNSDLISTVLYNGKVQETRQYDKLNRVTNLQTKRLSDNAVLADYSYTYNSLNQREMVEHQDGTYWDYGYDALGQVTHGWKEFPGGYQVPGYNYNYTFDGIGNRLTATANGKTQTYTPNNLNQYTQRTVPGAVDVVGEADPAAVVKVNGLTATRQGKHYYDEISVSNALQPVDQPVVVTADYGGGITATLEDESVYVPKTPEVFSYDDDGNMLTDSRFTYTWDSENRLIGLETLPSAPTSARSKTTYSYDYMGRRITKTTWTWNSGTSTWAPGDTTLFYYDGWNLIGEIDGAGNARNYVWGLDLSGSLQGAGGVGGFVGSYAHTNYTASDVQYAIADANGNVMKLISDSSTSVVGEYEYGPFGEVLREHGAAAEVSPFRFTSKYQDRESDLLNFGVRYYNSTLGCWTSRDPILEEGGINIYSIIENDPVNSIDWLGMAPLSFRVITPARPLKPYKCGAAQYLIQWIVDLGFYPPEMNVKAGWILQHVEFKHDVTMADGTHLQEEFDYTEAWNVSGNVPLEPASKPELHDLFQTRDFGLGSKGTASISGSAKFEPRYIIQDPPWDNPPNDPAGDLPVIPGKPDGFSGNVKHKLLVEWDCCSEYPPKKPTQARSE